MSSWPVTSTTGTSAPAVFWGVPYLQPGDVIRVVGEDGENYEYAVEWTQLFNVATELTPEVIQNDIVGDTGQETLTLITCGGDFDRHRRIPPAVGGARKPDLSLIAPAVQPSLAAPARPIGRAGGVCRSHRRRHFRVTLELSS